MPRCWQCDNTLSDDDLLCPSCEGLQPPRPGRSHFDVLGVKESYFIEASELESRFKALSRVLHPDRFAMAGPRARRFSMEHTTALNDAYRALRNKDTRARYLLERWGRPITEASGRSVQLPFDFMESLMELREGLAESRMEGDEAAVASALGQVKAMGDALDSELDALFAAHEAAEGPEAERLKGEIEGAVHRGRYLDSVLREARSRA